MDFLHVENASFSAKPMDSICSGGRPLLVHSTTAAFLINVEGYKRGIVPADLHANDFSEELRRGAERTEWKASSPLQTRCVVFLKKSVVQAYLLLSPTGDSAPSMHLSSWLATICRSSSSSRVSRSN